MKFTFKSLVFLLLFLFMGNNALYAMTFNRIDARAKQGSVEDQVELGSMYYEGRDVARSYAKAIEWWGKAAKNGHSEAHFNLAMMYGLGQGVAEDYVKAYAHFTVASNLGNQEAATNIQFLTKNMTVEQIMQAEKLASTLLNK